MERGFNHIYFLIWYLASMKSLHIEGQILQQREPNKWQMDSIDSVHVQNVHNSAQRSLEVNTNMLQSEMGNFHSIAWQEEIW